MGPSPLTRGKLNDSYELLLLFGTIPAHAGETSRLRPARRRLRDHPRSRGGNLIEGTGMIHGLGPSPLTRGKPPGTRESRERLGTIPAHAGETMRAAWWLQSCGDHPRSRGGNGMPPCARMPAKGPSPLTRGKRLDQLVDSCLRGTIPAHAGETRCPCRMVLSTTDHPRSRGGNSRT